jgi:hypothetical protein
MEIVLKTMAQRDSTYCTSQREKEKETKRLFPYIKVIRKVILSFTPYPLCFHPLSPLSVVSTK